MIELSEYEYTTSQNLQDKNKVILSLYQKVCTLLKNEIVTAHLRALEQKEKMTHKKIRQQEKNKTQGWNEYNRNKDNNTNNQWNKELVQSERATIPYPKTNKQTNKQTTLNSARKHKNVKIRIKNRDMAMDPKEIQKNMKISFV